MTIQGDTGQLVGHLRGEVRGYDTAAQQLVDFSGNGNAWPLVAGGPPAFGTYGGFAALQLPGNCYFGGQAAVPFLPTAFTVVAAVFINGLPTGGAPFFNFLQAEARDYSDPDWETATSAFGSAIAATQSFRLSAEGDATGVLLGNGGHNVTTAFTNDAWNIFQFECNPDAESIRGRIGSAAWATNASADDQWGIPYRFDEIRLGYRSPTVAAGVLSLGQLLIYNGCPAIDDPTGWDALIAALAANPNV